MKKQDIGADIEDDRLREIAVGGTAPPCPFCKIPRVQRSDYIRCCKCGYNWLEGEDLNVDPRITRFNKMIGKTGK